jgi:hypothetical protein
VCHGVLQPRFTSPNLLDRSLPEVSYEKDTDGAAFFDASVFIRPDYE